MKQKLKSGIYSSPMILIMVLTLLLLSYVGYGEAKRQYTVFQLNKLNTQGEIVKNAFDAYLKAGFQLKQFSGFNVTGNLLLKSDKTISSIRVTDTDKHIIFYKTKNNMSEADYTNRLNQQKYQHFKYTPSNDHFVEIEESDDRFQITQTLENKFGTVGYIILEASKKELFSHLDTEFKMVSYYFVGLSFLFILIVYCFEIFIGKNKYRQRVLQASYITIFIIFSGIIGTTVYSIYKEGAKASTKALSDSMTQRLAAIMELGIEIQDIKGIDNVFRQYKASNPDIESISITQGNVYISHVNPEFIGRHYVPNNGSLEYINILKGTQNGDLKEFRVAVTMPVEIVKNAILGSSKTFLVLFIACCLISIVFLNAGSAIINLLTRNSFESDKDKDLTELIFDICDDGIITEKEKDRLAAKLAQTPKLVPDEERLLKNYYEQLESGKLVQANVPDLNFAIGLKLIQPTYFLIVFVNAMSASFLPQLVLEFINKSSSALASVSLPFTIYYLFFALVLIPAGQYAEKGNLKKLLACGFLAEVIGLTLVAVSDSFWLLTLGRLASGIGQGFFLIGLQSYILAVTPKGKHSIGHAIKVIGRNSGLIAGTAIGALLYSYIDYKGVFILASIISISALFYLAFLVPGVEEISGAHNANTSETEEPDESALKKFFNNIVAVVKDAEFMKTLLTVGIIGKMSIAGVVMFAVPLLLSKKGFATDDIGLSLMLYYIFGMLTTKLSTKFVDAPGATRWVLSMSAVIGGLSSLFLGFVGIFDTLEETGIPGIEILSSLAVRFNDILYEIGLGESDSYLILFFIVLIGVSNGLLAAPIMTHIGKLKISEQRGVKTVSATYVFMERFGHISGPVLVGALITTLGNSTLAISLFGIFTILFGVIFAVFARTGR